MNPINRIANKSLTQSAKLQTVAFQCSRLQVHQVPISELRFKVSCHSAWWVCVAASLSRDVRRLYRILDPTVESNLRSLRGAPQVKASAVRVNSHRNDNASMNARFSRFSREWGTCLFSQTSSRCKVLHPVTSMSCSNDNRFRSSHLCRRRYRVRCRS